MPDPRPIDIEDVRRVKWSDTGTVPQNIKILIKAGNSERLNWDIPAGYKFVGRIELRGKLVPNT